MGSLVNKKAIHIYLPNELYTYANL